MRTLVLATVAAGAITHGAFAQTAKVAELEYIVPEDGCPMELVEEESARKYCIVFEESTCGTKAHCEWRPEMDGDQKCWPKRGMYVASPSLNPKEPIFAYLQHKPISVPKIEAAQKRAYDTAAAKKYSDAIAIYSRALAEKNADAYQSQLRTHRGLAHELKGDKKKALDDYCMSVAYATDWQSEDIARTRILQLADPDTERMPMVQFAKTGIIKNTIRRPQVARFRVVVPDGDDYIVKLENVASKAEEIFIYYRAGTTYEIRVPVGTYRMLFANGRAWYGAKDLFGTETEFYQHLSNTSPDHTLRFSIEGRVINGHEVRFRDLNGKAGRKPVTREEFGM